MSFAKKKHFFSDYNLIWRAKRAENFLFGFDALNKKIHSDSENFKVKCLDIRSEGLKFANW